MIRSRLEEAFAPDVLEIIDDGYLHEGHAGAASGMGHYSIRIVSERFAGIKPLERHRMVYAALGDMMETEIHAVRVTASCGEEGAWQNADRTEDEP